MSELNGSLSRQLLFFRETLHRRPFVARRILSHPHLQTMVAALARRSFPWAQCSPRTVDLQVEGRFTVRMEYQLSRVGAPTLLAVHGVGGSSRSPYMQAFLHKASREGWNALLLNLYDRNLGGDKPVIFHSGSSSELGAVIRRVLEMEEFGDLFLVAVSMGGNILLKLLGEWGSEAPGRIRAAAMLSPLVDLMSSWNTLDRPGNRHYRRHFVGGLKQIVRVRESILGQHIDVRSIRQVKTIREFDEIFTTVLGGFENAFDYYRTCSAQPWLNRVRIPTLIIHSRRDPILPWEPLTSAGVRENPDILCWLPLQGGHVGFIEQDSGEDPDRYWAENRIIDFGRHFLGEASPGID